MIIRNAIFISLLLLSFMSNAQKPNNDSKIRTVEFRSTETFDDIDLPPINLKPKFKTIHDWLEDICNYDKPKKSIEKYNIILFESSKAYTLALNGVNIYTKGNNSKVLIEFKPKQMYFALPNTYFNHLNRDQIIDKLSTELNMFSKTKTFQASFFVQANTVIFETTGRAIWSK